MVKHEKFIYIQMQKTACSHIAKLLHQVFACQSYGKHNKASAEDLAAKVYFIGGVRNPWEWYLSLWTFGVAGRGAIMKQLTGKQPLPSKPLAIYQHLTRRFGKSARRWQSLYANGSDVGAFRIWLQQLLQNTPNLQLGNYSNMGLMSYRYLSLFCRMMPPENANFAEFAAKNCYIDYFIKCETLADDLCHIVQKFQPLTPATEKIIRQTTQTNISPRPLPIADYYDSLSIDLVRKYDRIIVDKFNYQPPNHR